MRQLAMLKIGKPCDCWKRQTPAKKTSVFEYKIDIFRTKFSRRCPVKPERKRS